MNAKEIVVIHYGVLPVDSWDNTGSFISLMEK